MDQKYIMNKPEYKNFYFKQIKKSEVTWICIAERPFSSFFSLWEKRVSLFSASSDSTEKFQRALIFLLVLSVGRRILLNTLILKNMPQAASSHKQCRGGIHSFCSAVGRKAELGVLIHIRKCWIDFFLGLILCVVLFFYSLLLGIVRTKKFFESSNCQSIMGGKQQQNCQARNGDYFLFSGINLSSLMDLRTDETDRYWLQEIKSRTLDRTWKCNICYVFNCTKLCFQMVLFVFFFACHLHLCKQIAWYR